MSYKLTVGFRSLGEFTAENDAEAARKARKLIQESGLDSYPDSTDVTTIDPQGLRWVTTLGRFRAVPTTDVKADPTALAE